MAISASKVAELRKITHCPLMECKGALEESNGDIQKAVELLRKKGMAKAVKKADRLAMEGVIRVKKNEKANKAVMIEINCETDFVARNADFKHFCDQIVDVALMETIKEKESLLKAHVTEEKTIDDLRQSLIAQVGENILIRRISFMETDGMIGSYVHADRIGVLVAMRGGNEQLARDLAMHVAATNPLFISPREVPHDLLEKEREIYQAQAEKSGKSESVIVKMVEGHLQKFLEEIVLLKQPFIKETTQTVQQLLLQNNAEVIQFVRYELSESIESKN